MKTLRMTALCVALATTIGITSSCSNDDNYDWKMLRPTALVTVYPSDNSTFLLQLDNKTTLVPTNIKKSPFGDKVVRALVNYNEEDNKGNMRNVHINWIDSIRTKEPVICHSNEEAAKYGNDPIEIIKDWVTVAEDGYITLRIRTKWGPTRKPHVINLLSGLNATDAYEMELRHDAKGETEGVWGDALIAFNINKLAAGDKEKTIKLKWKSFVGEKSIEFKLSMHSKPAIKEGDVKAMMTSFIK